VISGKGDAEPVSAYDRARMDDNPLTEVNAVTQRNIGEQAAPRSEPAFRIEYGTGAERAGVTNFAMLTDDNIRAYADISAQTTGLGNLGRWVDSGFCCRAVVEQVRQPGISQIRIGGNQAIYRAICGIFFFQDDCAGMSGRKLLFIGSVSQECNL